MKSRGAFQLQLKPECGNFQGPVQQCWESVNVTSRSTLMSFPPQLLQSLDSLKERAKDAVWAVTSCLCKQSASVKINGRTCQYRNIEHRHILTSVAFPVKIVKVLGEGGFSFVYLVQDESSGVSTSRAGFMPMF